MRKICAVIAIIFVLLTGCNNTQGIKKKYESGLKTYYEMNDGTWNCDNHSYKYRLKIKGRLNNAAEDSTFIYLSNIENITFEQAWKASGLSSDSADYFPADKAVLVEMK